MALTEISTNCLRDTSPRKDSAFVSLYQDSRRNQVREVFKSHHRHIVELIHNKKIPEAMKELQLMYLALSDQTLGYREIPLVRLLNGSFSLTSGVDYTLVNSFHLLLLQTLLHHVSGNLQSVMNKENGFSLEVFLTIGRAMKKGGNIVMWIEAAPKELAMRHYASLKKVCSGFLKIIGFLLSRTTHKRLIESKEAWAILNLKFSKLCDAGMAIELPREGPKEFLDDFMESAGVPLIKASDMVSSMNPSQCLSHVMQELGISASSSLKPSQLFSKIVSHLPSLSPSKESIHIYECTLVAFRDDKGIDLKAFLKSLIQFTGSCQSNPLINRLLQSVLPMAFEVFGRNEQLVSLCLKYGKDKKNDEALLLAVRNLPKSTALSKAQTLRELALSRIIERRESEESIDVAVDYLNDLEVSDLSEESKDTIIPSIVLNALLQAERRRLLERIKMVQWEDSKKELLLCHLAQTSDTNDIIIDIYDVITIKDSTIKLSCQLELEKLTRKCLSLTEAKTSTEQLLHGAILTNRLKYVSGPLKPLIAKVYHHLKLWLDHDEHHKISVFIDAMWSLYHSGFYALTLRLLESSMNSCAFPTRSILSLKLLTLRCLNALGDYEQMANELGSAGKLMREMADKNIFIEITSLVQWKLHQLDYFINTSSNQKAQAKVDEITKFLHHKPEFNLESGQSTLSLTQTISCLLLNAHFLKSTAELQIRNWDYSSSLKNIKLAIKILVSILRKSIVVKRQKCDTISLLISCYTQGFKLSRLLGASCEACNMLTELSTLIDTLDDQVIRSFNQFILAKLYALVGEMEKSSESYEMASRCVEKCDIVLLDFMRLEASFSINALNGEALKARRIKDQIIKLLQTIDWSSEAFSLKQVELILCESDTLLSVEDSFFMTLTRKYSSRKEILLNAILTAKQELQDVRNTVKLSLSRQALPTGLNFTEAKNDDDFSLIDKLLDCKDALLKFLERNFSQSLGVEEVRELQDVTTRCIFTLSQFTVLKQDSSQTLLRDIYFLQDIPRQLPYNSFPLIYGYKQGENGLMPVSEITFHNNMILRNNFYHRAHHLLPENYLVVTIDVCAQTGDLILSKFDQVLKTPSFLRLSASQKSEEGFTAVMSQLHDIIDGSHQTTNSATTSKIKTREERRDWWKTRFLLDTRMKELVDIVEYEWICGFKGIFSKCEYSRSEFDSFKAELQRVWKSAIHVEEVEFSDFITELYLNLAGVSEAENKLLPDLIAYTAAELGVAVKSRKIVAEIKKIYPPRKALRGEEHLVLVPSHACSEFPWESLSFLRSKSVSRVPSLGVLLQLLEYPRSIPLEHNRFYVLNPSGDLKKTEHRFKEILEKMPRTKGVTGHAPSEEDLIQSLVNTDLFFYAGHGGGEQYMRMTQLMRRCFQDNFRLPPAILMGCSSGALQRYGTLEPSSNIMTWLLCKSPMIVSNLWDITDKDIDVFSTSVLRKWGLVENDGDRISIASAVAESRESCVLRYLNGAAPVVHGLPLRLE
ncbi:hypothetical protein CJI97_004121 [Candidozyma auris]|nr:hypothetical protein CJI97_004121 [[Candida] auris]